MACIIRVGGRNIVYFSFVNFNIVDVELHVTKFLAEGK